MITDMYDHQLRRCLSFSPSSDPLVWLHSEETNFLSDIGAQMVHTKPEINFSVVDGYPAPPIQDDLDSLRAKDGTMSI